MFSSLRRLPVPPALPVPAVAAAGVLPSGATVPPAGGWFDSAPGMPCAPAADPGGLRRGELLAPHGRDLRVLVRLVGLGDRLDALEVDVGGDLDAGTFPTPTIGSRMSVMRRMVSVSICLM